MSRFGSTVRTYGRPQNDNASRAFDAAMGTTRASSSMATSTVLRFGKTTFTSTRAKDTEFEPKRRRVEEEESISDDPFSFDSDGDEGGSKRPKSTKAAQTKKTSATNGKTVNNLIISRKKKDADGDDEEFTVRKGPTKSIATNNAKTHGSKSYGTSKSSAASISNCRNNNSSLFKNSSSNQKEAAKSYSVNSSQTSSSSKSKIGPILTIKRTSNQPSIESFMTKRFPDDLLSKEDLFSFTPIKKKTKDVKPIVKKFFTSSQDSAGLSDHNYSQSPRGGSPAADSDIESNASSKFLLDSDEDLESGDPEIVFNSPKKLKDSVHSDTDTTDEDRKTASPTSVVSIESETVAVLTKDGRDTPSSVISIESDSGSIEAATATNSTASRPTIKTYGGRLLLKKSSSENSGQSSSSRFNRDLTRSVYGSKKVTNDNADKNVEVDKSSMFADIVAKKLAGGEKKRAEKPIVRRLLTSPKKSTASYNARSWNAKKRGEDDKPKESVGLFEEFDFEDEEEEEEIVLKKEVKAPSGPAVKEPVSLRRTVTWPTRYGEDATTSLKVKKEHKELFTVVRNVKQAHEVQEHGENQDFDDDIQYIMEGIGEDQKTSVRCLSCLSLVNKAMVPAFRMHLRAHGTLTKVFTALHDAPKYPTVALCTGAILFMLSRDHLNMELEKCVLELMLQLLDTETNRSSPEKTVAGNKEYTNIKTKIQEVCEKVKADGAAKHLNTDDLTTSSLAMEALLSLTSKRAGDWFKEDIRLLGGLDHLIKTISDCVDRMDEFDVDPSEDMMTQFSKIERCLRVLEQVSYMNNENQSYLALNKSSLLIKSLCRILRMCDNILPFHEVETDADDKPDKESIGYIVYSCMACAFKVLLNLTHEYAVGCTKVGQQQGLVKCVLNSILQIPRYLTADQRFELLVLSLGLFINMVEHCGSNRQMIIDTSVHNTYEAEFPQNNMPALESLVQVFVIRFNTAQILEREQEEEKERIMAKQKREREGTPTTFGNKRNSVSHNKTADESGVWKESESGLEWIAHPPENNEADAGSSSDEEDEDDEFPSSQGETRTPANDDEKLVARVLHKAGRHMEDSIIAAYISLLIGIIIQNNNDLADIVREGLPEGNFENMILMLKKFLGFMNLTNSTNTGNKSIRNVIKILEEY